MKTIQTEMESYLDNLDNLLEVKAIPNKVIGDYIFSRKDTTLVEFIEEGREFIRRYLMVFRGLLDYGEGNITSIEQCLTKSVTHTIEELVFSETVDPIKEEDIETISRESVDYFLKNYLLDGLNRR